MSLQTTQRIGLLSGSGEIPVYFAQKAHQNGIKLIAISFTDEIASQLAPFVEKNYSISIGRSNKIFKTFREEKIQELLILGKVEKSVILRPQLFDLRALKFFKQLKNKEDKTVMLGVIREMELEGFRVLDQREFLVEIFPDAGVLTRRKPSSLEMEDIQFGMPIAKKLADMEIGQTILVKNKIVCAVEAIEGTDRALERGCSLARKKGVAIKVSRTNQDYRYDCPCVGPKTIEGLVQGKASVLALEAGRVMVSQQSKTVELADRGGLSIISF